MAIRFVGGPYDGREIDYARLAEHVPFDSIEGGLGTRVFVRMPPPENWDRVARGEPTDGAPTSLYEQVAATDGPWMVARPSGELDQARLEAGLSFRPRARMALSTLPPDDRAETLRAIAALQTRPPADWPAGSLVKHQEDGALHMIAVPGGYRAFVLATASGSVELLDVMRDETLRRFLEQYVAAGRAG